MKQIIYAIIVLLTSTNVFSMDQSDRTLTFQVKHAAGVAPIEVPVLANDHVTGLSIKMAFCAWLEKPCDTDNLAVFFAGKRISDDQQIPAFGDSRYQLFIKDYSANK